MAGVIDAVLGRPLASSHEAAEMIGPIEGVPVLGLDALASTAYGPEAALTVLLPLGAAAPAHLVPLILPVVALLAVVSLSYRQTIRAYPSGGGSYAVAKANLGARVGLVAAAALAIDYVLNVAVGVSAGVGALVSAVPALQPHVLALCLGLLALLTLVNLRGVREAGAAFLVPTYLFVAGLGAVVAIGAAKALLASGAPRPVVAPRALAAAAPASAWLLVRAFASGCTAMTGIEAVSNAVPAFRAPKVRAARRTLGFVVATLAILLVGIAALCRVYGIGATAPGRPGYESVLSQLTGAVLGRGPAYHVVIAAVFAVLALSANTSFAGFPRLCSVLATDGWLPDVFERRGRRLVYSAGILLLCGAAGILLVAFGGVTDRLIPLFAVGAFAAFTLSQAGMVVHWRRTGGPRARGHALVNGAGALATGATLSVVAISKFVEGAWITLLLVPGLVMAFRAVRRAKLAVRLAVRADAPLALAPAAPAIAVVPLDGWDKASQRALQLAVALAPEVHALHVRLEDDGTDELSARWDALAVEPARRAGVRPPELHVLDSQYRRLVRPVLDYVQAVRARNPGRLVAVVVPEVVTRSWRQALLRDHRATLLASLLVLEGGGDLAVVQVPWHVPRAASGPNG